MGAVKSSPLPRRDWPEDGMSCELCSGSELLLTRRQGRIHCDQILADRVERNARMNAPRFHHLGRLAPVWHMSKFNDRQNSQALLQRRLALPWTVLFERLSRAHYGSGK